MGTSAYDLERLESWGSLPELDVSRRDEREAERARQAAGARVGVRARRQTVTLFAVLGWMLVCVMLMLVTLSHMQLAMLSAEMGQLDRQAANLQAEVQVLQAVHESAFGAEVGRIAREELGMVEAARGQIVFVGSNSGDMAEVLHVAQGTVAQETGLFSHLMGLLREHLPFLS